MAQVKMADIAKMANVSLATVGRVIHQNGYVSEDKRKEIERIIEETGYVTNKIAQGLKGSKSKLIGHMTLFNSNMLYEQIADSINRGAYKHGYQVLTLTSHPDQDEITQQVEELISRQVEGVIITSNPKITTEQLSKFIKVGIPVVLVERTQAVDAIDCISVDDFKGAYDAVCHILKNGHRKIGFIGNKIWHSVEKDRYQGYVQAIADWNLELNPKYTFFSENYSVQEGKLAAQELLSSSEPPTAIFMTSDLFACGVLQHCYERGIHVPRDLSIVGYDNTLSKLLSPPITSMALPNDEIGLYAIQMILERIQNFERQSRTVTLKPVIIDRETVRFKQ